MLSPNYTKVFEDETGAQKQEVYRLDNEPIFNQILHNMCLGQGQMLKKKQRIRMRDAAVLIGVCDLQNECTSIDGVDKT